MGDERGRIHIIFPDRTMNIETGEDIPFTQAEKDFMKKVKALGVKDASIKDYFSVPVPKSKDDAKPSKLQSVTIPPQPGSPSTIISEFDTPIFTGRRFWSRLRRR